MYNTYIWLHIVQLFVVKEQRRTMLYKSVHHLELAVQGIIKPKKRIIEEKNWNPPLLYHSASDAVSLYPSHGLHSSLAQA